MSAAPLAERGDELADLVHRWVADGAGAWSMGVEGAVAEMPATGPRASVGRDGRTVTSSLPAGGMRLTVTDEMVAFPFETSGIVLAVPAASLPPAPGAVTVTPGDPEALDPEHGDGWLADLGLGRPACRFCVRTSDPTLAALLGTVQGLAWDEALDRVGHQLVAASPHRVVITGAGRCEVYAPIPSALGASPLGPHTHLLPARLRTGADLAPGISLPEGLAPAATFHPSRGWERP